MSALAETLTSLRALAARLDTPWFLFGAQAVAVHGAPRATMDVDVTLFITRDRLAELDLALSKHGLEHRYPELASELLTAAAVLPLVHESGMEVDIVIAGSGLEELALSRARVAAVAGVDIPVVHPTDLVVMKVLAGRGKDVDDARAVLAGGRVDLASARDLLGQLEEALDRSDLVSALDELVLEDGIGAGA